MRNGKRRWAQTSLASVLAAALLAGQPAAYAAPAEEDPAPIVQYAAAGAFPDVPGDHWADKYVTRMQLQGVIEGYEDGSYRPDQSVSRQDVLIMAIRFLGLEDDAEWLQSEAYLLPFAVSDYAKPYVALAVEKRLISPLEETSATPEANKSWGTTPAPREWVAKVVIRALGLQEEAEAQAAAGTAFADDGDISGSALGAVSLAAELGVIDGFEDGTFRPKQHVSRAQMAAVLTRAEPYSPFRSERAAAGELDAVDGNVLTLAGTAYTLAADAVYFDKNGKRVANVSLSPGDNVYLIHRERIVYYLENSDGEEQPAAEPVVAATAARYVGLLKEVRPSDLQLILEADGTLVNIPLALQVIIVEESGAGRSLGSLAAGSLLDVSRSDESGKYDRIVVLADPEEPAAPEPAGPSLEGTVLSVDVSEKTLTVLTADRSAERYEVTDTAVSALDGLLPGMRIRGVLAGEKIVSLEAVPTDNRYDTGVVVLLPGPDRTYMTISKGDNQYGTYNVDSAAEIVIPGKVQPVLGDLLIGDEVSVALNEHSVVTQIVVLNRTVRYSGPATVVGYDPESNILTVLEGGEPAVYVLDRDAQVIKNGRLFKLSEAPLSLGKNDRVSLSISNGNKVASLQVLGDS